ncbi:MAG: hypothetical protein QM764_05275 [Chitinophagaceae bacterium]
MEQGFDPEVKKYFRKIIASFSWGFLWLFGNAIAGLYFKLSFFGEHLVIFTILYYILSVAALIFLLLFYYKTWSKRN